MKTQLLQDFDESGSAGDRTPAPPGAPAPLPAVHPVPEAGHVPHAAGPDTPAPPRPAPYAQRSQAPPAPAAAVWHRPQAQGAVDGQSVQRADAGAMGGATAAPQAAAGQMRPPGTPTPSQARAAHARQHAAAGAWTGPRPLPPEARTAATGAAASPPPIAAAPAADLPDWLTERLREDAEQETDRQRKRLMARRALGWSAAATVVAMLAVGGYWFYQESRVDGALDVVANTSPAAPALEAAPRVGRTAAAPAPASPPASPAAPVSGTSVDMAPSPADAAPEAAHVAGHADAAQAPVQSGAANAPPEVAAATQPAPPIRKTSTPRHHQPAAHVEARTRTAVRADSEPTPDQRRWETLMQCRALGYDERECRRRGCMMTRFGLACPG